MADEPRLEAGAHPFEEAGTRPPNFVPHVESFDKLTGAGAAAFLMDWAAPVIERPTAPGLVPDIWTDIRREF